jgi:beta-galactosidase
MDEMFDCWTVGKNKYDYHLYFNEWSKTDTADTVHRDRNHPSIILYSAGNEIHDTPKADLAKRILASLIEVFHANDPTRPVTQALFRPNVSHDYQNGLADMLDVVGQNYRENEIIAAHQEKPTRKILGTENGHDRRGWLALRDTPAYAGQFLWTGIDYLGESREWPIVAAGSGLLDRTGMPRPMGYERQSWWSDRPMVYVTRRIAPPRRTPSDPGFEPLRRPQVLFPDWTPPNLQPHDEDVEVYSNCQRVELFLNGQSLGSQSLPADASPRKWKVSFAPGALKAVASNDGKELATHELRTAGQPAKILLAAERSRLTPAWDDVCYVNATVVDDHGTIVPNASQLVTFKLTGPGVIAAVDSANNFSHEPFHSNQRLAYQGRCFAILRAKAPGELTLTASAPGLSSNTITVSVDEKEKP